MKRRSGEGWEERHPYSQPRPQRLSPPLGSRRVKTTCTAATCPCLTTSCEALHNPCSQLACSIAPLSSPHLHVCYTTPPAFGFMNLQRLYRVRECGLHCAVCMCVHPCTQAAATAQAWVLNRQDGSGRGQGFIVGLKPLRRGRGIEGGGVHAARQLDEGGRSKSERETERSQKGTLHTHWRKGGKKSGAGRTCSTATSGSGRGPRTKCVGGWAGGAGRQRAMGIVLLTRAVLSRSSSPPSCATGCASLAWVRGARQSTSSLQGRGERCISGMRQGHRRLARLRRLFCSRLLPLLVLRHLQISQHVSLQRTWQPAR